MDVVQDVQPISFFIVIGAQIFPILVPAKLVSDQSYFARTIMPWMRIIVFGYTVTVYLISKSGVHLVHES